MKTRTPTETLIAVMDDFGNDEPINCLVIYTTQNGDIAWSSSSEAISAKLGLIEACRAFIIAAAVDSGKVGE